MRRDRLSLRQPVGLDETEHDNLASRTYLANAAEGGFVAFEAAVERLAQLHVTRHRQPDQPVEQLGPGRLATREKRWW